MDEASYFCRWLRFSAVLQILERHEPSGQFVKLYTQVEDILRDVGVIYKGGRVKPQYDASDIEAIHAKLDFLLSKTSRPVVVETDAPDSFTVAPKLLPAGRV